MRRRLLALVLTGAMAAQAQDAAREARWAAEVRTNLVVGDAVSLPFLGLYTEARPAKGAVVLVHGVGVHPDFGVIGELRTRLADSGYTTLSIQMPVQAADAGAEAYPPLFPDAAARIAAAAAWLSGKGYARPVLLSHSMGSRMADQYWLTTTNPAYAAWVSLGITLPYASKPPVPLLDVQGDADFPAVLKQAGARKVHASRQETIPGADHYYTGREKELAAVIDAFLVTVVESSR